MERRTLCRCREGRFTANFRPDAPIWDEVKQHCVRVVISPFFYVPILDTPMGLNENTETLATKMNKVKFDPNASWSFHTKAKADRPLQQCDRYEVATYLILRNIGGRTGKLRARRRVNISQERSNAWLATLNHWSKAPPGALVLDFWSRGSVRVVGHVGSGNELNE
jgi:hypothetical protein